jgi:CBS domain-containing protein
MTRAVRTIDQSESLAHVRDLMIRSGYGRLPVLSDDRRIVGLLTERDLVAAHALAERANRRFADLTVADVLPPDALDRVVCIAPDTPREDVAEALTRSGVIACLVTPDSLPDYSAARHHHPCRSALSDAGMLAGKGTQESRSAS